MAKPLFVATADLHLDDLIWVDRPSLRDDTYVAFRQICQFAVRKKIPIIAAGDLLDKKRNDSGPVDIVRREMDILAREDIPFYFIQGQHDMQSPPWFEAAHSWPTWLDRGSVRIGDYMVSGMDWTPPGALDERLSQLAANVEIVVMHQVCHHWMGGITAPELDFAQVPNASLLLVGDYHKHEKVQAFNKQGDPMTVLSPGSTAMQKIDEERTKRFFVVFDDLSVKSVKLKTRPVIDCIPLVCEEDVDHWVQNIRADVGKAISLAEKAGVPEVISEPIVYVSYDAEIPDVYERITNAFPEHAHLFRHEIPTGDDELGAETSLQRRATLDMGLLGSLGEAVSHDDEPEVYGVCHALLSTDRPEAVLSGIRKEWLGDDDEDDGEEEDEES